MTDIEERPRERGELLQPLTAQPKPSCLNFAPAGYQEHWREWHRGHGCEKDPGLAEATKLGPRLRLDRDDDNDSVLLYDHRKVVLIAPRGAFAALVAEADARGVLDAADSAPPTRRYFRIVAASGPTWWMVSRTPPHAWRQWATWHIDTGCSEEMDVFPCMTELTVEQAAQVRVSNEDDPTKTNLALLELGATICTEY